MASSSQGVRERNFTDFAATPPELLAGNRHWLARAQNFWLEWVEVQGDAAFGVASDAEVLLIAPRGALRVQPDSADAAPAHVPPHAVAILPAGRHTVTAEPGAVCVLIASQRGDLAGRRVLNQPACEPPDARVLPAGRPWHRTRAAAGIEVLDIDAVRASPDKPRLKMLQTETLSINIVEYEGARDRKALSPHAHADFEQGSLAISGDFVHHLRVPWGSDADAWREDEHLAAPAPSLLVVPVEMVHTTEGAGPGQHLLLDIFCPPRADFIRSGWVFNAGDYSPQPAP